LKVKLSVNITKNKGVEHDNERIHERTLWR
jgi:hypothetical protein